MKNSNFNVFPIEIKKVLCLLGLVLCLTSCEKDMPAEASLGTETPKLTASASQELTTQAFESTPDFSIIMMPDVQYYTDPDAYLHPGGKVDHLRAQTDWIKNHVASDNIAFVAGLGDIANHADREFHWTNAKSCYDVLETFSYTNNDGVAMPDGIPYGLAVGNHDQEPYSDPTPVGNSTPFYNEYFGVSHFSGRNYYGGHYSTNNDSHYDLFSVGTGTAKMDFIILFVEYDANGTDWTNINAWLNTTLQTYSSRKAIIISHSLLNQSAWEPQGLSIYNAIKARSNVFMMYCGHRTQENWRLDTYNGSNIRTFITDYQGEINGGDGFMRVLKISPANNTIYTKSISPYNENKGINRVKEGESSKFYVPAFTLVPTAPIANGKYKIINRKSGKVITVQSAGTANGDPLNQWDYTAGGSNNDQWNLVKLGTTGYYKIVNVKSGKVITINSVGYQAGENANQWDYTTGTSYNDEFAIVSVGSGYYKIVARHTNLVLNVEGGVTTNGAFIQQWPYNAATNAGTSEWAFELLP